jgi:hypothetical protein
MCAINSITSGLLIKSKIKKKIIKITLLLLIILLIKHETTSQLIST